MDKSAKGDPEIRSKTHFWPFDGFDVPEDKSVVVEVFPTLFRRRFNREGKDSRSTRCLCCFCLVKGYGSSRSN